MAIPECAGEGEGERKGGGIQEVRWGRSQMIDRKGRTGILGAMESEQWWCPPGRFWPWFSLFVLGALTLLPALSSLPIVDRDEPRFAHATIEMIDRGEWLIPYFNDEYRFDKPPLTYWWMRLNYALFGRNEFAARLHSVIAAMACAGVLFAWGRQLFDRSVGWWAAIGWLTCLQVLVHGRTALADMPMVLAVMVTQWSLWQMFVERSTEHRWWWALWLSQGLGFLAKGPIAVLVPLLTWVAFAVIGRVGHRWPIRWWGWILGAMMATAMVAAWGVPALLATEGAYWNIGVGKHVVERGIGEFNARSWNPAFYLVIFFFLFPWAGGLPRAFLRGCKDAGRGRFLVLWLLVPVILFTFYQTQLPHYILPGYGGALLLIFGFLSPDELSKGWFPKLLGLIVGVLGTSILFIAVLSHPHPELVSFRYALASLGLALMALTGLWWSASRDLLSGVITAVLILAVSLNSIGNNLREGTLSVALGEVINVPVSARCVGVGYREGSLIYYTDRFWRFPDKEEWPRMGQEIEDGTVDCVVFKRRFWNFEAEGNFSLWPLLWRGDDSLARTDLATDAIPASLPVGWTRQTLRGLNLGQFTWVEVEVWHRPE